MPSNLHIQEVKQGQARSSAKATDRDFLVQIIAKLRKQKDWKTPAEFPQIPQDISATPLQDYLARLPKGAIYTRNRWGESPVYDAAISEDGSHLAVITEISGVTKYALSEVFFI